MKSDWIYEDFGGQSVNLTKFWDTRKRGMSIEEAAFETPTGIWAKENGFTKVWYDPINFPLTERKVILKFLKN